MSRIDQPTTDLEARLRASLAQRADDVSASPAMWDRVDERISSRRRRGIVALVGWMAMVLAAGAIVVPNLLDRPPTGPTITVDPSPAPSASPSPSPDGPVGSGYPAPTHAVVGQGDQLAVVDVATGATTRQTIPLAGEPLQIAARPHVNDDRIEVAYVIPVPGGWQLRLATAMMGDDPNPVDVELVTNSASPSATQPGVAWSPDGRFVAWVYDLDDGEGPQANVQVVDVMAALGESFPGGGPVEDLGGRFLLADGAMAGTLTLKSWTWDHQYEDGRAGRLLFTGSDGRSWAVEIIHSFTLSVHGLDEIPAADDFDDAGPDLRTYLLRADAGDGSYLIAPFDDGIASGFTFSGTSDPADGPPDLAVVGQHFAVTTGRTLVIGTSDESWTDEGAQPWGPVDLLQDPWLPPDDPAGPQGTDDPIEVATLPGFIVTSDGTAIDLRRSDGQLIQTLVTVTEGAVLGVDVRPGSSTEDLTVVYSTANLDGGGVTMWTLRGRADDQAGLAVDNQPWPAAYQPADAAQAEADGERTVPVFADDGTFVAFVENQASGAGLRIFGWLPDADIPGTGRTADDNVAFDRGPVPATLETFTGPGESRGGGVGYVIEMTSADGTATACEYERQSDGALAEIICDADRGADQQVVDLTDRLLLDRFDGRLRLLGESGQYPLPAELEQADPETVWMTGRGNHVFVGDGERAWLVTVEGAQELPAGLRWVSGVR